MQRWKSLVIWVMAAAVCVICMNYVFLPKWTQDLASTYTVNGFYAEEKDSLDVVFFGSSQVGCGISPMEIYEKTGMRSYVLGTGSQSIICTYYWIREMEKYQKPEVVVLDTWMAVDESIIDDGANRNALDYMKFSMNKMNAAFDLQRAYNEKYGFESTPASYALPILRFHDRWKELEWNDVAYWFSDKRFARKGYCPSGILYSGKQKGYRGIRPDPKEERWAMSDHQAGYLQKIIDYCKEEQINLLLVKTPLANYNVSLHNAISDIAADNQVPFVDLNMKREWKEAGMEIETDFQSPAHLNLSGANKVSAYLSDYLLKNYKSLAESVEGRERSPEWDRQLEEYRSYEEPFRKELRKAVKQAGQSASSL